MVTADGGLTTLGYGVFIAAAIVMFMVASFIAGEINQKKRLSAKQVAFCALSLALSFVTSYVRLIHMPWGGSVTLCSMLFICLCGNWYGPVTGILVGLVYGIMQFIQEPFVLSPFQVCCDYIFAFAALGAAGFFYKLKNRGLLIGVIVGCLGRAFWHILGGYLYWMEYMPENFPKSLAAVYPIAYNLAYIVPEMILILIIVSIPAVKAALGKVKEMAVS